MDLYRALQRGGYVVRIYMKCAGRNMVFTTTTVTGHCHRGSDGAEHDAFATAPAPPVANYVPLSAPAAPARVFARDSVSDDSLMSSIRRATIVQMRTQMGRGTG
jgi:hypothetical protein